MLLSKSTFTYGCQCQKRLYLHKHKPELTDPYDEETLAVFQRGTDVGLLAQQRFSGGINAQADDLFPGYQTAKRTAALLATEEVLFEATFIYEDVLCAVDILVRTPNGYEVYEVKSTNQVKPQHKEDAAVQYFVLNGAGIKIHKFYILHFNRDYVRRGELDLQELFSASDITTKCIELQSFVAEKVPPVRDFKRQK